MGLRGPNRSGIGVSGDPELGPAVWQTVVGSQGVACGEGTTVSMPTAPFPSPGETWDDASVRVFVPEGYRERRSQDVVLHFHGFWGTVTSVLSEQQLQEHLFYSGDNAVLVVPQGPQVAASCSFGKLMAPEGTEALLREVLVLLYREGRILEPVLGNLVLTAHSGGYWRWPPTSTTPSSRSVRSISSTPSTTRRRRSSSVPGGRPTALELRPHRRDPWPNVMVGMDLADAGIPVVGVMGAQAFRDETAVIYPVDTAHMASTRIDNAYGEQLRWAAAQPAGPPHSLRSAVGDSHTCEVTWLSPIDESGRLRGRDQPGWGGLDGRCRAGCGCDGRRVPVGPAGLHIRVRPRMKA